MTPLSFSFPLLPLLPLLPKTLISPSSFPLSPLKPFSPIRLSPPLSPSFFSKFRSFCASTDYLPIQFEEIVERDWSFLEPDDSTSQSEQTQKLNRVISASELGENSRVLLSLGSEDFVDKLVESANCSLLLVVHYSLLSLALIKEKYDKVRCWQGELVEVPEKWVPFDVVFISYLPALNFSLDRLFEALAWQCLPGAKVIISHTQGREIVEQHRQQNPDVITSDLPCKSVLEKVATAHSFQMAEFIDEPTFYLAILKFCKTENST